jgi:hypothetical protein
MYGKTKKVATKKPVKMANGGKAKAFKPCSGCPSPGKCAKMGMCMAKASKK